MVYGDMGDTSNIHKHPSIEKYLKGEQKYEEGKEAEGPKSPDSAVKKISKQEMEKLRQLEKEGPKLTKQEKIFRYFEIAKTIPWQSVKATKEEADEFQKSLCVTDEKGHLKRGEIGKVLEWSFRPRDDELIKSTNETLFGGEKNAIRIYTTYNYLVINGTLDKDETSLRQWLGLTYRPSQNVTEEKQIAHLKAVQNHVNTIAKFLTSGINKLPSYQGQIYRGDAMTPAQLNEWRTGKIIMTTKFFSCSPDVGVGEKFARQNAIDYMKDKGVEYKPVLYVFNSKNSKDIRQYSNHEEEDERIYTPGQGFRSVDVDEKTVPGLAIIYMEEMA